MGVKRTFGRLAAMSANDPKRTLQSRCALRIWDLPAPTIERAKTMALLSIRPKRCATNDAWADVGCLSIKPATGPSDIASCGGGGERPV